MEKSSYAREYIQRMMQYEIIIYNILHFFKLYILLKIHLRL